MNTGFKKTTTDFCDSQWSYPLNFLPTVDIPRPILNLEKKIIPPILNQEKFKPSAAILDIFSDIFQQLKLFFIFSEY
jgi:hypothetical protein